VGTLLQLATAVQESGYLRWNSAKGKAMSIKTGLVPVSEARGYESERDYTGVLPDL